MWERRVTFRLVCAFAGRTAAVPRRRVATARAVNARTARGRPEVGFMGSLL
jgi:hypothetical protein